MKTDGMPTDLNDDGEIGGDHKNLICDDSRSSSQVKNRRGTDFLEKTSAIQ